MKNAVYNNRKVDIIQYNLVKSYDSNTIWP